jgi:hypothetical protein
VASVRIGVASATFHLAALLVGAIHLRADPQPAGAAMALGERLELPWLEVVPRRLSWRKN